MPAQIQESEIKWVDPVKIKFGFTGLTTEQAVPIMRSIMQADWPKIHRPSQCIYIIRLIGDVAIAYPNDFSPVIYIGAGNASDRLYDHAKWLAPLVLSVQQIGIEVRVAAVSRRNHGTLYHYIEADLLRWFCEDYGALPWFNRQRERAKEEHYDYEHDAERSLRRHLGAGSGNSFLWAIKPTKNNDQYEPYDKGVTPKE